MQELLVVSAAWCDRGRCFAAQRPEGSAHERRWEFPGGKVEPGETLAQALRRELSEELGLQATVGARWAESVGRTPGGRPVRVVLFEVFAVGQQPELREHQASRWCTAAELLTLEWVPADVALAAEVARRLAAG